MKKIIISFVALSALSGAAFAASVSDKSSDRMDTWQIMQQETTATEALVIKQGETDADKYLNPRQLR